jgi:hypothetical protein
MFFSGNRLCNVPVNANSTSFQDSACVSAPHRSLSWREVSPTRRAASPAATQADEDSARSARQPGKIEIFPARAGDRLHRSSKVRIFEQVLAFHAGDNGARGLHGIEQKNADVQRRQQSQKD